MNIAASGVIRFLIPSLTLSILTGLLLVTPASAQPPVPRERGIQIIDLGTLGGDDSGAWAIDAEGQVVGWSLLPSGERRAFTSCADCTMQNLGTLIGGSDSIARAVSNNGNWLAGSSGINAFGPMFREFTQGFVYNEGLMRSVGALHCPCTFNERHGTSEAFGVNDLGTVVGWAPTSRANYYHAFRWKAGVIQDISETGGGDPSYSRAFDVNNAEQIVGYIAEDDSLTFIEMDRSAFIWEGGSFTILAHLTGYTNSTAVAINEIGDAVGWSGNFDNTDTSATFWSTDGVISLGTLDEDSNSRALALNDNNQVVGWSGNAENDSRAFFWQDGVMLDLNSLLPADSEWHLIEARGINNQGMITGTGLKNAELRAFLLIPPSSYRLRNSARHAAVPPGPERGRGPGPGPGP